MSVLPDVLAPELKIVFCGTAAGDKSAQVGAYYAGPGNRFWETLHRVGLTPYRLQPHEFKSLLQFGLGLTDLAQHTFGGDKVLTRTDFQPQHLITKVMAFQPGVLAFNGKRAAQEFYSHTFERARVDYGLQPEQIGKTSIFVLPSTSGAARGFWDEGHWVALAEYVRGGNPTP